MLDALVFIALGMAAICTTIIWQGHKSREITKKEGLESRRIGLRAAEAAENAHNIVNSQRSEMLRLLADLRAENARLRGQPRPSNAILGVEPPTNLEPIIEDPETRRKRLITSLEADIARLKDPMRR